MRLLDKAKCTMAQVPLPTPTDNDVPSTDIRDAVYAGAMLDKVVTSTELTYKDRHGGEHYTVDGIKAEGDKVVEETRQNLIPLSRQYMTLAAAQADIANIPEGSTTYYRSPDDSALAIEVINNGGTLEATGREMPSTATIDAKINEKLPSGDYLPSFFPVMYDKKGNVPIWLDESRLDAAGIGPVLQNVVKSTSDVLIQSYLNQNDLTSDYFPLYIDSNGNVPIWMDRSRLDAAGIGPVLQNVVKSTSDVLIQSYLNQNDLTSDYFPLYIDSNGNVPIWMDRSRLDAAGIGPVLQQKIYDLISNKINIPDSSFIEGDQYKFTFKKGRLAAGQSVSLNLGVGIDSWGERSTIPQAIINILGGVFKDPGWINCSTRSDGVMAGITLTVNNFTKYDGDNENNNAPPQYGAGPDGNAYYNVNTIGTLTWSNVTATDLSLFYYDGTGSFTITIDGGSPVTITGANTSTAKKYDITGLTATSHTVLITSSGTGVVSILGMYGKNGAKNSGITVSRMGNGGAMASDYLYWKDWISPIVSNFDLDLFFMIVGTNDFRKSAGITEYINGLQVVIDKYKEATPGICICLVSPAQSNASGSPALSEYDKAMRELAVKNNVNMISLYQLFPKTYDNSSGAWVDSLHLSSLGAYVLARKIKDKFMQE